MKRLRRAVFLLLAGLAALITLGSIYQAIATRLDARRYPPLGERHAVNDHALHMLCRGTGSPTVILESGLGEGMLAWALVQPEISEITRVCSYDRAGYGWSDRGPQPRTAGRIVAELDALLHAAGESGPYVMVGHSFGGPLARLYAARHADVVGLVLVDASHEDQMQQLPDPPPIARAVARLIMLTAPVGLPRILAPLLFPDSAANLPPRLAEMERALTLRTAALRTAGSEYDAWDVSMAAVRAEARSLQDRPLVVLTAGRARAFGGMSETDRAQGMRVWDELQRSLAALSTRGTRVIASESAHHIQLDQPELVVQAVRNVVEAARAENL